MAFDAEPASGKDLSGAGSDGPHDTDPESARRGGGEDPADGGARHGDSRTGGSDLVFAYLPQVWVYTVGLFSYSVLTRVLEPEGMGAYATCTVFVLLLAQLFLLGSEIGTQYFMVSKQITIDEASTLNIIYATVGATLAVLCGYALVRTDVGFLSHLFGQAPAETLYLSLVMMLPLSIGVSLSIQLSGLRRFDLLARTQLMRTVTVAVSVVVLVWILDIGVNGGIIALTLSHFVTVTVLFWDLRREYKTRPRIPERRWFGRTLGYGLKAQPFNLGINLERRMGIIGLGLVASGVEVGLFAVAISLFGRLAELPHIVGNVAYPRLFADSGEVDETGERASTMGTWLRLTGGTMTLLVAMLFPLVWPAIFILNGRKYLDVVPSLWILAPGLVALALASLLVPWFNSISKPAVASWAMGAGVLAHLLCLVILLPRIGLEGAAIALTVGASCRTLVLATLFHRLTGLGLRAVWMPHRGDIAYLRATLRNARSVVPIRKAH